MHKFFEKWCQPLLIQIRKYQRRLNNGLERLNNRGTERFVLLKLQEFVISGEQKPLTKYKVRDLFHPQNLAAGTIFRIKLDQEEGLKNNNYLWFISGRKISEKILNIYRIAVRRTDEKSYILGQRLLFGDNYLAEPLELKRFAIRNFSRVMFGFLPSEHFAIQTIGNFEIMSSRDNPASKQQPRIKVKSLDPYRAGSISYRRSELRTINNGQTGSVTRFLSTLEILPKFK